MKLLDLFCGAGGAAMGYHRAGFEVVGVDINPQPNYPFEFYQADALDLLKLVGHEFDVIHASPPCQAYSALNALWHRVYPDLIEPTRDALLKIGKPFVIENVPRAPVRKDLVLCGEMFGLDVIRHRHFETHEWAPTQPEHKKHRGHVAGWNHGTYYDGPYFAVYGNGGGKGTVAQWQQAMGIDWTGDKKELAEAIPPTYTEYIGGQLMEQLNAQAA